MSTTAPASAAAAAAATLPGAGLAALQLPLHVLHPLLHLSHLRLCGALQMAARKW
jgi:hypothetical protein